MFQQAYGFQEGLARVKLEGAYTYVRPGYLADTTDGTKPFGRYTSATDFVEGRARVTQLGRTFFIDDDADEIR